MIGLQVALWLILIVLAAILVVLIRLLDQKRPWPQALFKKPESQLCSVMGKQGDGWVETGRMVRFGTRESDRVLNTPHLALKNRAGKVILTK